VKLFSNSSIRQIFTDQTRPGPLNS
jgi:hypothetical protein